MTQALEDHCAALPGAFVVEQWMGSHVFKVGTADKNKVFAIFAGEANQVTLKCADPDTAAFLIEIGAAQRAPHLPRGGWVAFDLATAAEEDLRNRLTISYELLRASLTKATQAALPPHKMSNAP